MELGLGWNAGRVEILHVCMLSCWLRCSKVGSLLGYERQRLLSFELGKSDNDKVAAFVFMLLFSWFFMTCSSSLVNNCSE